MTRRLLISLAAIFGATGFYLVGVGIASALEVEPVWGVGCVIMAMLAAGLGVLFVLGVIAAEWWKWVRGG